MLTVCGYNEGRRHFYFSLADAAAAGATGVYVLSTPLDPNTVPLSEGGWKMKASFTPGPWHVGAGNGAGSVFADVGRMRLENGGTTLFPIAFFEMGWLKEVDEANGLLIAASPELFALAERVARLNRDAGEIGAGMLAQLVDEARAVVAKAKGETPRIRSLSCCCCGNTTRGRQWWNRDTGFGLCDNCITFVGDADVPVGETTQSYGVRGFHYDVSKGV